MSEVISVKNVSKTYTIGHELTKYKSFRDEFSNYFKNFSFGREKKEQFHALDNISLTINKGDTVGIIGPNGAGKSTLLKILSRITLPTKGEVRIREKVSSLLEVGTGFHPELTGRENIFLNGAVLGMKQKELKAKFDEIVAFSGVEKFLDTQLKRFSSGMQARLAFAIAAHLDSEILLVDEVLAVGDVEFQKKCLAKMNEIGKSGNTVVFVSHNMSAISELCKRTILIDHGKIISDDLTRKTVSKYLSVFSKKELMNDVQVNNKGNSKRFYFKSIELLNSHGKNSPTIDFQEPFKIKIKALFIKPVDNLLINITVASILGNPVYNSQITSQELKVSNYRGSVELYLDFDPNIFGSGTYSVTLSAGGQGVSLTYYGVINFTVTDNENFGLARYIMYDGYVTYPRTWVLHKLG